jgi:hypothetical protein
MLRRRGGTVGAMSQIALGAVVWMAMVLLAWHEAPCLYAADFGKSPMGYEVAASGFSPDRAFFSDSDLLQNAHNDPLSRKQFGITPNSSGPLANWQAIFTTPWQSLLDDSPSSGLGFELLYQFDHSSPLQGLALSGKTEFSYNPDSYRIDGRLMSMATRMLESEPVLHRLHLNVAWSYNSEPGKADVDSNYALIVGYDYRIGHDMMLIFDFVHEKEMRDGKEANVAEAGVSYRLMPLAVLAIGGGATLDDVTPGFRSALTFQYSF